MAEVKRVGIVIGTDPAKVAFYKRIHADDHPGVRHLLRKYHIHNFSIFSKVLDDGKEYLFGYYEYTGADYNADMAELAAEPENQKWLETCDPCQVPLQGCDSWADMQQIYYNE